MIIKFVDKHGSLMVVTVDDDADFNVDTRDDGTYYIVAYKSPHTSKSRTLYRKVLAESLDKTTADKCIEQIFEAIVAKETSCDLVDIQLGKTAEETPTDE